jgi:hypothetical protein
MSKPPPVPASRDSRGHTRRSLDHFAGIYRKLDPGEISRRTALPFDSGGGCFRLRIMGAGHTADFPEFSLKGPDGNPVREDWKTVLFLRFLCEGRYAPAGGTRLSYREIPWGNVYYRTFESRCLRRFARVFGADIEQFRRVMETCPGLNAGKLEKSDAGYRFEFVSGLFMDVYLWAGDDEFPPSAQMLFDDNFPQAFTAEDIAVAGEAVIDCLKSAAQSALPCKNSLPVVW